MVTKRPTRRRPSATKAAPAKATRRRAPSKAAKPAPQKVSQDVTVYADKAATPYHKAMAKWAVVEVGVDLDSMSVRQAFLKGVQIATAARPVFMQSEFLEEWRAKSGEAKRGPKPKNVEVEEDDEDFDDEEIEDDDEDFEDDDDSDDEDDDDEFEDEDDDDEDFEDDEEEEAPPAKPTRRKPSARSTSKAKPPARRTTRKASKPADDDEDLF